MTLQLSEEETFLVETVREFVNREVKPTVRDVEHANEYPEAWIEQLPQMHEHYGKFGDKLPDELRAQLEQLERRLGT